jgi:hypothetical protein
MSPDNARALPQTEFHAYLQLMPRVAAAEARWLNTIDKGDPKEVDTYLGYLAGGGEPAEYGRLREEAMRAVAEFQEALEKGATKR